MTLLPFVFILFFSFPAAAAQAQRQPLSSGVELAALYSLRSSLGLRSRDWPRKNDPCSAWAGVRCRPDGRVVGLELGGLRRTRVGRLDPRFAVDALGNLTLLVSFNASGFPLPGPIPDWFGPARLPSLVVLDISSCSVAGPIPPALAGLSNLTLLNLSSNSLSGSIPDQLFTGLASLSVLDLSRNRFTGSIPSVSSLQNLTVFHLFDNFLAGPIPPEIGTLANLTSLDLSNNSLSGTFPPQLGDLSRLLSLDLGLNSLIGPLPADLGGLRSLQRLAVGGNSFDGALSEDLFTRLSRLRVLILSSNGFSGDLPGLIWRLPELQLLDFSGNNFTGVLPKRPAPNASNATAGPVFNLSHNQLYGSVVLSDLTGFRFIDLSDNYFQGRILRTGLNASLTNNCLQNATNQKSFQDCESFYAARGLIFGEGSSPPAEAPQSPTGKQKNQNWKYILAGVFGGLGFIVLLVVVMVMLLRRRGEDRTDQRGVDVSVAPSGGGDGGGTPPPGILVDLSILGEAFSYEKLLLATQEFSDANLIKHGHSGDLYQGRMENGIPIVVKRVDVNAVKKNAFMAELEIFTRISHTRLVPLLGHCLEQETLKFLVYKYMPNGDLSSSLYRKTSLEEDGLQSLDWITRLKIATGVAEALSYLHHECTPPFVHRDVQASSILLDDKFEVRLGSLSEICSQEGDAHQNVITRFLRLSQTAEHSPSGSSSATCAYDVYCLGKVLLELVTGKLGVSGSNDASTNEWLDQILPCINVYEKDMLTKIVDPSLIVDEDLLEEVWAMAIVAKSCLNPKPSKRPLTRYVLKALENPLKVVREDNNTGGSARLRTTSSRGSWNAAFFGSWRHSSSDIVAPGPPILNREGSNLRQVGRTGSQGSGKGGDFSSSQKRLSKEIFPEPANVERQHVERSDEDDRED